MQLAPEAALEAILTPDEDALVASENAVADPAGAIVLWRPIADVHLGHIGWTGEIDHLALQDALACAPRDPAAIEPRWRKLLGVESDSSAHPALIDAGGSALEVALSVTDLQMCEALVRASDDAPSHAFVRALVLPERMAGGSEPARAALTELLSAYRGASLAHAWSMRLGLGREASGTRERDESAVALLSTLRAVLGER